MGPFAAEDVVNQIKIRKGQWIGVLGQTSDEQKKKLSTPLLVIIALIGIGALAWIWSARTREEAAQ